MSDQYQDEILKDISKSIKEIKQELITKNKIDSINLVFNLASNDTFKQFTENEIEKVMPKFNKILNAIHKNIYDN